MFTYIHKHTHAQTHALNMYTHTHAGTHTLLGRSGTQVPDTEFSSPLRAAGLLIFVGKSTAP